MIASHNGSLELAEYFSHSKQGVLAEIFRAVHRSHFEGRVA